jgi:DNA polymerase III delta prime subunit
MSAFKKATKTQSRLRLALYGPSGSGKTYTALTIAQALGKPVAVIDTERGSASKYAGDVAEFDVLELTSFEPAKYIAALKDAAGASYPTVVIDSLSHAWMGKGGLLDQADAKGGRFDAWKQLTPQQHSLIDAILAYPGDVIVTMRTKTEYIVEKDERGKSAPRKVGTAPVQKDGVEYEFDVAASLDMDNTMHVEKSRCPTLQGAMIRKPGADVAHILRAWLSDGAPAPVPEVTHVAQAENTLVVDMIRSGFAAAQSLEDLNKFAEQVKQAHLAGEILDATKDALGREYLSRKRAIASAKAADNEAAQ